MAPETSERSSGQMNRSNAEEILIAGTRGSALALAQTKIVSTLLEKTIRNLKIKTKVIKTSGDASPRNPGLTGKDSFTKEIDSALLDGEIDFAVHSLKDVPVESSEQGSNKILVGAYPKRGSPYDVLICRKRGLTLDTLPGNARVGTSSLRRGIQLKLFRPDLEILEIHGNVPTRISKLRHESSLDALVLAKAGLDRLHIENEVDEVIKPGILLPAPGQGCLAVSIRSTDTKTSRIVQVIDDKKTRLAVTAERAFSSELGGGCNTPIAAFAKVNVSNLSLEGLLVLVSKSGKFGDTAIRDRIEGDASEAEHLGRKLARRLLVAVK